VRRISARHAAECLASRFVERTLDQIGSRAVVDLLGELKRRFQEVDDRRAGLYPVQLCLQP
jgi:hypothetical protein